MIITIPLIIVSSVVIYLFLRRYIKKLIVGSIKADTQTSKVVQEIVGEVNALIVEFNGVADRNITIVEDRIARLSSLVEKSGHAITILSNYSFDSIDTVHAKSRTANVDHLLEQPQSFEHSSESTISIDDGNLASSTALAINHDNVMSAADGAGRHNHNYSVDVVHQSRSKTLQTSSQKEDLVSHIRRLYHQQVNLSTIAKQVGVPIGEVETYISLFDSD